MKTLDHVTSLPQLLRLALEDMKKIKADKNYKLDVDVWHGGLSSRGSCEVCIAGAIMAKTLELDQQETSETITSWDYDTQYRLGLVDRVRTCQMGRVRSIMYEDLDWDMRDYAALSAYLGATLMDEDFKIQMGHTDAWTRLVEHLEKEQANR